MSSSDRTEIAIRWNRAGVVDSRGLVPLLSAGSSGLRSTALQASTRRCTGDTVLDHLLDFRVTAGIVIETGSAAIVALEKSWIYNAAVSRVHEHAAKALLHHDRESKLSWDAGRLRLGKER